MKTGRTMKSLILLAAFVLNGCAATKYGFVPDPDVLPAIEKHMREYQATHACSMARFYLRFPDNRHLKETNASILMDRYFKTGVCAPFSQEYSWYSKTPPGNTDAAWSEPENAEYRGNGQKVTRELMMNPPPRTKGVILLDDFNRGRGQDETHKRIPRQQGPRVREYRY